MDAANVLEQISRCRTDRVFDLMSLPDWHSFLDSGKIKPLQWFVYCNDVTALEAVLINDGTLDSIDLNTELQHAAFFGHWKVCDFLLKHGADVNCTLAKTGETPLHGALSKAGRPHYIYTIRLLLEHGADVNVQTIPDVETDAFMRDVRTKGETPLHRAAAFAGTEVIQLLLDNGANKEMRDSCGDSPLTWASQHLRPGAVLSLLAFGNHRVGEKHIERLVSDHGSGWGNGMEWNLMGDYIPNSKMDFDDVADKDSV